MYRVFLHCTILISVLTLPGISRAAGEETIVVRRGTSSFDVTITNDIDAQIKLWNGLRERTVKPIKTFVETGKSTTKGYAKNFVFRYQPTSLRTFLEAAFERTDDEEIRIRAAQYLIWMEDFRGVDWALEEIESVGDPVRLRRFSSLFNELFTFERLCANARKAAPVKLSFSPGVERLWHAANQNGRFEIEQWIYRIEGDAFLPMLRKYIQQNRTRKNLRYRALRGYAVRFPDPWLIEFCQEQFSEKEPLVSQGNCAKVLNCLSQSPDPEIRVESLKIYEALIEESGRPVYHSTQAMKAGVVFTAPFLQRLRKHIHDRVKADLESTDAPKKSDDDTRYHGRDTQYVGWERFSGETLAYTFAGSNDQDVIDALSTRLTTKKSAKRRSPEFFGYANVSEVAAIKMISDGKFSAELNEYLKDSTLSIAQMEYRLDKKDISIDDIFDRFHHHGVARDLTPIATADHLRKQRFNTGQIIGSRELLGPQDSFCAYELIRGALIHEKRWGYMSVENYISSFWRMVDLSQGEFQPEYMTMLDDKKKGKRIVGFIWKGKRYQFRMSGTVGHIASINAVLRHQGSKNGYVEFLGRPDGGFLTPHTPKVVFAPNALIDELEEKFFMAVRFR